MCNVTNDLKTLVELKSYRGEHLYSNHFCVELQIQLFTATILILIKYNILKCLSELSGAQNTSYKFVIVDNMNFSPTF